MNPWERVWLAPAKINLFLHVVGRRADGYHLLQTVFRFLDYGDELRFSPRSDGRIVLATPLPGVPEEADLTARAARLLREAAGIDDGVTIHLTKRLPIGGGLGGGSSDAATSLVALNELWNCGMSRQRLQEIALSLGADVPVFVHGRACFAEGVGERFADVALPPAWYLVTVPPVSVPTATVFSAPDLRRNTPEIRPADWRPGMGGNDLEPVACRLFPEIARHLDWLKKLDTARMAAMTGSGACCIAEFGLQADAENALLSLPADMRGFVARGLDSHPHFS